MFGREAALPLLLPGQDSAVAEEGLSVDSEPVSMTVEVLGGVPLAAAELPPFVPAEMDSFTGSGLGPSTASAFLWNPYPEALTSVSVAAMYFDSSGDILGGKSAAVAVLEPGEQRFEVALTYAPWEEYIEDGRAIYVPPRVAFYMAPRPGSLANLLDLCDQPAEVGSTRDITWTPATLPPLAARESAQPFAEQYGPVKSLVYLAGGEGPAELVYETPRFVRWLNWQGDSTALHLDVISHTAVEVPAEESPAFIQGLVSLAATGGALQRELVAVPLINPSIAPSPLDGRAVFHVSDQEGILVVQADGSAARLKGLGQRLEFVSWSPLGDRILVFVYETLTSDLPVDGSVYVVPLQDGPAIRITPPLHRDPAHYAAWSPDGMSIAFQAEGRPRTPNQPDIRDLFIFDLATQESRRILVADQHLLPPVWSADGRWLLLGGDLVDPQTGDLTRLTQTAIGGAVSPDGNYFIVTEQPRVGACPEGELANRTLVLDLQTGEERVLLDCDAGFYHLFSHDPTPRWTAGGDMALLSSSTWGSHGHVWKASLLDIETGRLTTLVERPEEGRVNVVASPDGFQLLTTGDALRLFDADGTLSRTFEVPAGFEVRSAAWSPDGSMIAFVAVPQHAFLGP